MVLVVIIIVMNIGLILVILETIITTIQHSSLVNTITISSCTIWYCVNINTFPSPTNSERINNWTEDWGLIYYNHKINYENNFGDNMNGTWGNYGEWITSGDVKKCNWHNTTLLFIISRLLEDITKIYQTIPSCTIWYCINLDYYLGNDASEQSYGYGYNIGHVKYNYKLSYISAWSSIWQQGQLGNSNGDESSLAKLKNYHNTTLLFGNTSSIII